MNTESANKELDTLIGDIEKNGIQPENQITRIQKIRESALKENDPLITRALRLTWQHMESSGGFTLNYLLEEDEDATPQDNLVYMLSLCRKSDNTYNRDELREMTNMLQEMA
jgi:hypothetical protein